MTDLLKKVAKALCNSDTDAKPCPYYKDDPDNHCNGEQCSIFKMAEAAIKAMIPNGR